MENRVVITGMGLISSLGNSPEDFWQNLTEGRTGIRKFEHDKLSDLGDKYAGWVDYVEPENLGSFKRFLTKNTRMFISCCRAALDDSKFSADLEPDIPLGMVVGSAFGNIEMVLNYFMKYLKLGYEKITPLDCADVYANSAIDGAAIIIKARGIHKMVSAGVSSSLCALGNAYHYIKRGFSDIILSGGHENIFPAMYRICLAKGLLAGSGETGPRPFDAKRSGIILGEGNGVLVLENLERAIKRKAKIYAEIIGFGGGFKEIKNGVPVREQVTGLENSVLSAVQDAGKTLQDIDYINASANGGRLCDGVEARAMEGLFKPVEGRMPVSSIKGAIGEAYGASGAMQCISSILAMTYGEIPPTLNCTNPDIKDDHLYMVTGIKEEKEIKIALINSMDCFGFNNSLLLRRYEKE